jgi:hypothetical protein
VSLTASSFSRLCRDARKAFYEPAPTATEKDVSAKVFYIIGQQGKSSAATALFKNQNQLLALTSVPWADINWYATHPKRSSISGMYSELGFPNRSEVTAFEKWVDSNASDKEKGKLFSSVTGMQHGRGIPKEEDLTALKRWCVENSTAKEDWPSLLSSVTGMQSGRGSPKEEDLYALKRWCVENSTAKEDWFSLLSSVTGMHRGRGAPKEEDLNSLKVWCESKCGPSDNWKEIFILISAKQAGIPPECLTKAA